MGIGIDKIDARWSVVSVLVANPAAGVDWSYTVPAGQVARIKSATSKLTTSSTVANRVPEFVIKDASGTVVFISGLGGSQTASLANTYSLFNGSAYMGGVTGNLGSVPMLPDPVLPPGWTIAAQTVSLQTGDQWSNVALMIELADAGA